jgi:hypothetical protein
MGSNWFLIYFLIFWKLLELYWYVMCEEPNNIMDTMMNTSMCTMNSGTYY